MVRVCSECGAEILNHAKHVEFHGKIDELIEWAQNVSEYFVERHSAPAGGGLREILHRINDGIIAPGEALVRSGIEIQARQNESD